MCRLRPHESVGDRSKIQARAGLATATTLASGWWLPVPRLWHQKLRPCPPQDTLGRWRTNRSGQSDPVMRLPPPVSPRTEMEDRRRRMRQTRLPETRRTGLPTDPTRTRPPTPRTRRTTNLGQPPRPYTSPMSSFHSSGRASMNPVIMSTHLWSSTTTTSTLLALRRSSAPRKVRFSPITTLGIP